MSFSSMSHTNMSSGYAQSNTKSQGFLLKIAHKSNDSSRAIRFNAMLEV